MSAFKGQKYSVLKKNALKSGTLFEDPEFPPSDQSLFCRQEAPAGIEWKRPNDICDDPHLFIEGVSSHDLIQGELGNCWLVAACSCLALHKSIWSQVIVDAKEQEWDSNKAHAGIFHFRFWRYGEWLDVVIDDYLPTRRGKLIYLHSPEKNEFWSALLEKAYAKLFGCYESLAGGDLAEALEDFTGGVSESYDLVAERALADDVKRVMFYKWLKSSGDDNALMCASLTAESPSEMEKATDVGLVKGHAYSVTAVRKVRLAGTGIFDMFNHEKLAMIRLRNPWGGSEWTGAFSDSSEEWQKIVKSDREKIGLTVDNDGEFWMTFNDFCAHFSNIAICHRVNTSIFSLQKRWRDSQLHGAWTRPNRVGGCINNRDTFFKNPQFLFNISEDTDEVMFELTQKAMRGAGVEKMAIGFTVIKVEDNREYRLHSNQTVVDSSVYRNSRSVFWRQTLNKGRYVLVACTFEPQLVGEFMLRSFAGHDIHIRELTLDHPKSNKCCSCLPSRRRPECVTRVKVCKASGLTRKDKSADVNAYCIISCEGNSVESQVLRGASQPEWNVSAVFYRRQPADKPLVVDVWHHVSIGFDEYLGGVQYAELKDGQTVVSMMPLRAKQENRGSAAPVTGGQVAVEITTQRQLDAL